MHPTETPSDTIPIQRWIASSLVGWIIGIPLVGFLASIGENIGAGGARVFVALGVGAAIGGTQAVSNRGTVIGNPRWLLATAIGLAIPPLLLDLSRVMPLSNPYGLHASIALGGLTAGFAQSRILRARFANTGLWIAAALVGWTLFALGSGSVDILLRGGVLRGVAGAGIYLGLIALGAVALGAVLGWAFQRLRER